MLLQIWIYDYPVKYLAYYPIIPENISYWWIVYTVAGVIFPLFLSIRVNILLGKARTIFRRSTTE